MSSAEVEPFKLGNRPALDGLRAVAILAVIGYHTVALLFAPGRDLFFLGGGAGVTMFFVLSGFLITSLLLEERAKTGRISLRSFYKRRALRLFPALYFLLAVDLIYTLAIHYPVHSTIIGDGVIAGYVSNWGMNLGWPQTPGFTHTWSLAVEEQFYLVWPLVLIGLLKLRSRFAVPAAASMIYLACAGLCAFSWATTHNGIRAAETQNQAFSLMLGALLAWALHAGWKPSATLLRFLAVPSLAFLAWEIQTGGPLSSVYFWGYEVIGIATAVLILAVLEPVGVIYRSFASAPMRWIGRLSYSLYLWHLPVFAVARTWTTANPMARFGVALVITFATAIFSRYAVEIPFLRLKDRAQASVHPIANPLKRYPISASG